VKGEFQEQAVIAKAELAFIQGRLTRAEKLLARQTARTMKATSASSISGP